jgi:hypothetical protein
MYGQRIRIQFLDASDAFKMFDCKPTSGLSDSAVIRRRMGLLASGTTEVRYKFIYGRILRKALATVGCQLTQILSHL